VPRRPKTADGPGRRPIRTRAERPADRGGSQARGRHFSTQRACRRMISRSPVESINERPLRSITSRSAGSWWCSSRACSTNSLVERSSSPTRARTSWFALRVARTVRAPGTSLFASVAGCKEHHSDRAPSAPRAAEVEYAVMSDRSARMVRRRDDAGLVVVAARTCLDGDGSPTPVPTTTGATSARISHSTRPHNPLIPHPPAIGVRRLLFCGVCGMTRARHGGGRLLTSSGRSNRSRWRRSGRDGEMRLDRRALEYQAIDWRREHRPSPGGSIASRRVPQPDRSHTSRSNTDTTGAVVSGAVLGFAGAPAWWRSARPDAS
jgi:hypothetical protein